MTSKASFFSFFLAMIFVLGSCASTSQNKKPVTLQISTLKGLARIVPGKATQGEVLNELGSPDQESRIQDSNRQLETWNYLDANGGQWASFTFEGQDLRSAMWIPKPNEARLSLELLRKEFPKMKLMRGSSLPSGPDVVGVQDTNFQDLDLGMTILLHEPSNEIVAVTRFEPNHSLQRRPSSR